MEVFRHLSPTAGSGFVPLMTQRETRELDVGFLKQGILEKPLWNKLESEGMGERSRNMSC